MVPPSSGSGTGWLAAIFLFPLSFCVCQSLAVLEQLTPSVDLTSEKTYSQPEIPKTFLCLVRYGKRQYRLQATCSFTCLWNPSAIIFTKTCLRAVQIVFRLFLAALCDCYGADTFPAPATPHLDAAFAFCTGQAYLSPSDCTAHLAHR